MIDHFPSGDVLPLDCERTQPGGWDRLGLSVWDTNANGLEPRCEKAMEATTIVTSNSFKPVIAVKGPALDRWCIYVTMIDAPRTNPILLQLKTGVNASQMVAVEGSLNTQFVPGFLCQISGRVATQWEIWGRIELPNPDVRVRFRFMLDRTGGSAGETSAGIVTGVRVGAPLIVKHNDFTVTLIS